MITIDARGKRCPLPVILLARAFPELEIGSVVRVLADDPAAAVDIPAWCRMKGQEFVGAVFVGAVEGPGYDVRRIR